MLENKSNKQQQRDEVKTTEEVFFFPDYQLSITAKSQAEAHEKLEALLAAKAAETK